SVFDEVYNKDLPGDMKGISVNSHDVIVYSDNGIWLNTHLGLHPPDKASFQQWKQIKNPESNEDFEMPKNWKYEQVFAADDGSILAIIEKKIYSWFEDTWTKNEEGEAVRVFKLPIKGWDVYSPLRKSVETYLNLLKETPKEKQKEIPAGMAAS